MKRPERIYKFQALDQYSLRNLKNAQIYFNSPADFNDPFDCAVGKEAVSHTKQELLGLLNSFVKEGTASWPVRIQGYSRGISKSLGYGGKEYQNCC